MTSFRIFAAAALVLGVGACSSVHETGATTPTTVSDDAKTAAVQNAASFVTEVTFAKGSAELSAQSRQNLKEVVDRAKAAGQIEEVKIVTWSDMAYPANEKALPKTQRDLASKRNTRIKDYLKATDRSLDVDTYNMSERPGALAELFNTDNAQLKKSLEQAGIAHQNHDTQTPPRTGKAIAMVILKD